MTMSKKEFREQYGLLLKDVIFEKQSPLVLSNHMSRAIESLLPDTEVTDLTDSSLSKGKKEDKGPKRDFRKLLAGRISNDDMKTVSIVEGLLTAYEETSDNYNFYHNHYKIALKMLKEKEKELEIYKKEIQTYHESRLELIIERDDYKKVLEELGDWNEQNRITNVNDYRYFVREKIRTLRNNCSSLSEGKKKEPKDDEWTPKKDKWVWDALNNKPVFCKIVTEDNFIQDETGKYYSFTLLEPIGDREIKEFKGYNRSDTIWDKVNKKHVLLYKIEFVNNEPRFMISSHFGHAFRKLEELSLSPVEKEEDTVDDKHKYEQMKKEFETERTKRYYWEGEYNKEYNKLKELEKENKRLKELLGLTEKMSDGWQKKWYELKDTCDYQKGHIKGLEKENEVWKKRWKEMKSNEDITICNLSLPFIGFIRKLEKDYPIEDKED